MRILDLGCHDGYISSWVGRKFPGSHIDGVELNEHAVAEAQRRSRDHGIPGEFKIGRAEDAPTLFESFSYDAVIAFELIEHVPDVDAFLTACERMLKPGGRVYLSTPNGTFGTGQNPHHLRVYRIIDLLEVCRRRGTIMEAIPGPDGVSFVSYEPDLNKDRAWRPEISIYTGPAWKPWHPLHMDAPGGLGGSETAAARLGEALTDLGCIVTIYGEFTEQGMWKQIVLRSHEVFDPMERKDAVIVSRSPQVLDEPINAERVVLWMHDTDYGPLLTEERAANATTVAALSNWHVDHLLRTYPFLRGKVARVRNGIHPDYFKGEAFSKAIAERDMKRAIFTSSPDRGLDLLLEWWPDVLKHVPDAKLYFAYADVYKAVAESGQRPEVAKHQREVNELVAHLDGAAVDLGNLSQEQLVLEMARSALWLHPSWNTPHDVPFEETFCIGAVESGLAGCARLTSDYGALRQRLDDTRDNTFVLPTPPDKDLWVECIVHQMQVDWAPVYPVVEPHTWRTVAVEDFWDLLVPEPVTETLGPIATPA